VEDSRVARGMRAQLALRRKRLEAGETALGWKVGFGSPASLERLGLSGPLVGFLLREARVVSGASVSVGGWAKAVAEPEIAVHLGADVPGGSGLEEAREAIVALGPAIELADVSFPADDVERILAANIYQRAVVLGPRSEAGAGGAVAGVVPRVYRDERECASTAEPEALTGPLVELVCHLADVLAALGEALRAGEVVIAGSVVPPLDVAAGEILRFELAPFGAVEVALVA
jgi:2-keto-4-pentenoate hydratase